MKNNRIEKSDQEWKEILPEDVYTICRLAGTEPAFTGKYWDYKEVGVYNCACCGAALFKSETKFDSGSGWPSFFVPVADDVVRVNEDTSHGMVREEVLCAVCDAHLGHVFPDGPPPTGQRYCINSASLQFEPAVESFTY